MEEQICAWQCTHSVHTHRNSYARASGMPTGLTEDLVMRYLYNSIKWHAFGDLERMVELGRNLRNERKNLGRQKRKMQELDVNTEARKRTKLDDLPDTRICCANSGALEKNLAEWTEKGYRRLHEFWYDNDLGMNTPSVGEVEGNSPLSLETFNTCL